MKAANENLKKWAYGEMSKAKRRGELSPPDKCAGCGASRSQHGFRLQAHHADYSKPLDVRWLCPACHRAVHTYPESELSQRFERIRVEYEISLIKIEDFSPEDLAHIRLEARLEIVSEINKMIAEKQREILALMEFCANISRHMH